MTRSSIYRSNHPDVKAALDTHIAQRNAQHEAIAAFKAKYDFEDREALLDPGWGRSNIVGFSTVPNDRQTPPKGWRTDRRGWQYVLVPYLSRPKWDKAMLVDFQAIPAVDDVRYIWPGMPAHVGLFRSPASHPATDGYQYVDWQGDGEGQAPTEDQVDLTIWEPMLRSNYERLREAGTFEVED